MSFIDNYLDSNKWKTYLAFGGDNKERWTYILNAVIIFFIQYYFTYLMWIGDYILE